MTLHILHLEDNPTDAELAQAMLEADGIACQVTRVETRADFLAAVEQGAFDLILADYSLPAFDGLAALEIAREKRPEAPFIFLSGTLGEEVAIESLKNGARDYVLKERLSRLAPSVRRALREAAERTARQRAEEAQRASEKRFRALIENSSDVITLLGADGTILYHSPSASRVLGFAAEERVGRNAFERIHPEDLQHVTSLFAQVIQTPGASATVQVRWQHKDGEWRWIEAVGANLLAEPNVGAIVANYRDISERKRAEDEIRLLQTMTQAIGEAPDFHAALRVTLERVCQATGWHYGEAWVPRPDGSVLEPSPMWYGTGKDLEQLRQVTEGFTFPPGRGLPGRVWASKQPEWIPDISVNREVFLRAPSAAQAGIKAALGVPVSAHKPPAGFKAGLGVPVVNGEQVLAVLAFFMFEAREEDRRQVEIVSAVAIQLGSVLERKQAEEAVRQSEARYRTLVEQASDGIFVGDSEGRHLDANPSGCAMLGYTREELLNLSLADLYIPEELAAEPLSVRLADLKAGKTVVRERRLKRKDGTPLPVEISAKMLPDGRLQGIVRDISERKQAEEALRKRDEHHRNVVESIFRFVPEGLLVFTENLSLVKQNKAFEEITQQYAARLGYTEQELADLIAEQVRSRLLSGDTTEIHIPKKRR